MEDEKALKKARSRVLRFLTYRGRSKKEVADYMERKGFSQSVSEQVLSEMQGYGYIDDCKFASEFINYRKMNGQGIRKIRYELQLKGIKRDIIDELVAEKFDPEEDFSRIKEILDKREPPGEKVDQRWVNRQAAYLQRRGFQDNLIFKALKDYDLSE